MFRLLLIAALVALSAADKVYQCKSTYSESLDYSRADNWAPTCTGYEWPPRYTQMCSKNELVRGEESAFFTVTDNVVPMCYTWVLHYKASFVEPGNAEERQVMYLHRGANLLQTRKSCEDLCKDAWAYKQALGNEYQSIYFGCSYAENGNTKDVTSMLDKLTTTPTGTACTNGAGFDLLVPDVKPPTTAGPTTTPAPIDPSWSSTILIVQIVLIALALVLLLAGAVVFFLFWKAKSDA